MKLLKVREIEDLIRTKVAEAAAKAGGTAAVEELDVPRDAAHGDYTTNQALRSAKALKKNPKQFAQEILDSLQPSFVNGDEKLVERFEIAGPGFINVCLTQQAIAGVVSEILEEGKAYGCTRGGGEKVLLEFVSANPTGPLTIAHGRQAALGDTLGRIMKCAGNDVFKEYYNNDSGVQIRALGKSLHARCRELKGMSFEIPENGYRGDYVVTLAEEMNQLQSSNPNWLKDDAKDVKVCEKYAKEEIMKTIVKDLDDFGVSFDAYYSQEVLDGSGKVEAVLEELKQLGKVYENEGAWWLRSTEYGDDKDRVVVKSDKTYTYLLPDIAYHHEKFKRGFEKLVNLLGPDHHGYIKRIKASQAALGHDSERLNILIVQLVSLFEGDKQLKMSTRAGEFITLRQLMDEVGADAARYFFLTRKCDSHLEFDLQLAKQKNSENPVYYVQYVHARIASIEANCAERGIRLGKSFKTELLTATEEIQLMRSLRQFARMVRVSSRGLEPLVVADYLQELAARFHQFYQQCRVMVDDADLAQSRLALAKATQTVIRNGLGLLGVSAPEKM